MQQVGYVFVMCFCDQGIIKIVIIEVFGIVLVVMVGLELGVLVIFVCKYQLLILKDNLYIFKVFFFIKQIESIIVILVKYLNVYDYVLVIDDFFVNGYVVKVLIDLIGQVGVSIVGFGIVIEKFFQDGCVLLESEGYWVEFLVWVKLLVGGQVEFFD